MLPGRGNSTPIVLLDLCCILLVHNAVGSEIASPIRPRGRGAPARPHHVGARARLAGLRAAPRVSRRGTVFHVWHVDEFFLHATHLGKHVNYM